MSFISIGLSKTYECTHEFEVRVYFSSKMTVRAFVCSVNFYTPGSWCSINN